MKPRRPPECPRLAVLPAQVTVASSCALPPPRRRPVTMATPSRRGPWNLPSGQGAARRGAGTRAGLAAAGRGRRRGGGEPSSTRRGGGDCGQARPGFEPPSRAHLPAPTRALPRLSPDAGFLLPAPGKAAGAARAATAGVRMGTAGDPSSSLGACGCTVERRTKWVGVDHFAFAATEPPLSPRLVPALRCGPGGSSLSPPASHRPRAGLLVPILAESLASCFGFGSDAGAELLGGRALLPPLTPHSGSQATSPFRSLLLPLPPFLPRGITSQRPFLVALLFLSWQSVLAIFFKKSSILVTWILSCS